MAVLDFIRCLRSFFDLSRFGVEMGEAIKGILHWLGLGFGLLGLGLANRCLYGFFLGVSGLAHRSF